VKLFAKEEFTRRKKGKGKHFSAPLLFKNFSASRERLEKSIFKPFKK
jgi:hypothetical protein